MGIIEIEYKRTRNLGDYNSETTGAKYQVAEGENASQAMATLKTFVIEGKLEMLEGRVDANETQSQVPLSDHSVAKQVDAKPVGQEKPKKAKKVKQKDQDPTEKEVKEIEVEDKKAKAKNTPYDRENKLHKTLFGQALDRVDKSWRSNPSKAKALSVSLEGKDFLDSEGAILPEFESLIKTEMAVQ